MLKSKYNCVLITCPSFNTMKNNWNCQEKVCYINHLQQLIIVTELLSM